MDSLSWIVFTLLAAQAYAQGTRGGIQYPPCNSQIGQTAQYYGCWDITPFSGATNYYNVSIVGATNSFNYYPGWVSPGGLFDDSVNPANCTVACRGHGFKYSILYNGQQCQCGMAKQTSPSESLYQDLLGKL